MSFNRVTHIENKYIMRTTGVVCQTARDVLFSKLFKEIVTSFVDHLHRHDSQVLNIFNRNRINKKEINALIKTLQFLGENDAKQVITMYPEASVFLKAPALLERFINDLYHYWRGFDRFLVCYSDIDTQSRTDIRPYRKFNKSVEQFHQIIRGIYRDIKENITGIHPRIYRQVKAGCQIGMVAVQKKWPCPGGSYESLGSIPMIRQIVLGPPLIFDPPTNKRTGQFAKVDTNPIEGWEPESHEWFCFPARVGPLLIHIFFHQMFIELGCSMANLFELAGDEELNKKPDAIFMYGVPGNSLYRYGSFPTVFFEDQQNDMLIGAIPGRPEFGYFGYLKKMTLTLHNIVMMKQGRMPFHGAMARILMKNGIEANIVLIGDSGAGKSESLEAFRVLADQYVRDIIIVADDMGSMKTDPSGKIIGYGTETGAFIRLDDLEPGFALGNIDGAIIMSHYKINARAILPITTIDNVLHGYPVDYILYANNYEEVDEEHSIIEKLESCEDAIRVFREGTVMAKGTTSNTGIGHTYFANIFGPAQYKELHDRLAYEHFKAAYNTNIYMGQIRTRLGLSGWETRGPEEAAKALFDLILSRST